MTSGDRAASRRFGDKSRFVKEIEEALLAGEVDLAVHSAKDVPGRAPRRPRDRRRAGGRGPARRARRRGRRSTSCLQGARVGTSSLRRRSQLLAAASRPRGARRCAATSTRACASSPTATTTRSCWRSRGCAGSGATHEARRRSSRTVRAGAGPGSARARGPRRRRRTLRARSRRSTTRPRTRGSSASARSWRRSTRAATRRSGASPCSQDGEPARARLRRACPTAREWITDGVEGDGSDPARSARCSPSACSRPERGELLRACRVGCAVGSTREAGRGTVFLVGAGPGDPGLVDAARGSS